MFAPYENSVNKFFSTYNPLTQTDDESARIASALLKPDLYDFLLLMRNNYYPLDKVPKILSEWADFEEILQEWTDLGLLETLKVREISDLKEEKDEKAPKRERERDWLVLKADIRPLIFFPEYILPKIRKAFREETITYEIAKKAYDLLEVTFQDEVVV